MVDGLLDWETDSSARGTVLEIIQPGPAAESPSPMVGNLGSMIFSDPPDHDVARRIVNRCSHLARWSSSKRDPEPLPRVP